MVHSAHMPPRSATQWPATSQPAAHSTHAETPEAAAPPRSPCSRGATASLAVRRASRASVPRARPSLSASRAPAALAARSAPASSPAVSSAASVSHARASHTSASTESAAVPLRRRLARRRHSSPRRRRTANSSAVGPASGARTGGGGRTGGALPQCVVAHFKHPRHCRLRANHVGSTHRGGTAGQRGHSRSTLRTHHDRDPLLLRNLIQTDELDANSKAACLRWRAPGEGGAGRVCGAVATNTGPTTLVRFARWVVWILIPPRAPLFRPQARARAQHPPRARGGAAEGVFAASHQHIKRPRLGASARASWVRGGGLAGRGGVCGALRRRARRARRARPPRAPWSRADRARAARLTHEMRPEDALWRAEN